MWERRYECTYFLLEKIPSIDTPGRTLLDETYQANVDAPFHARMHLMHKRGEKYSSKGPLMSPADGQKMMELLLSPEQALEGLTVADSRTPTRRVRTRRVRTRRVRTRWVRTRGYRPGRPRHRPGRRGGLDGGGDRGGG